MFTIEHLEKAFPNIEWHLPTKVRWPDKKTFACRICIANYGLKYDSEHQWPTTVEAEEHIARQHLITQ